MSERDELALELFIADNHKQPRETSIADWEYFQDSNNFQGRVEHYEDMAVGAIAAGYRKVTNLDASTVERVANVLIEDGASGVPWEDASSDDRTEAMDKARVLLEAAGHVTPRTITTAEELDVLELRSVVHDNDGEPFELTDNGWRYWLYDETFRSLELSLPATVLWEPKP